MSSGLFNSSEPVRTIVQHWKPGLQLNMTWVRGGSTFPNLFEPLSSRGNKDHRIIWHEFGLVQLFRTCSNYSSTQETRPAVELDMSSGWFNSSEPVRTIVQHREPVLQWSLTWVWGGSTLLNLLEQMGSRWNKDHRIISHEFGLVQLFRTCSNRSTTQRTSPQELSGSNRFGRVEPPRTHVKIHHRPGFLCELWFEQVRKSWTTPNSWEIILWSLFPLELSGSNRFGRSEQHEKLSYDLCSLWSSEVRWGSVGVVQLFCHWALEGTRIIR